MAKKIYDIKPPKVAKKTEKDIKDFLKGEKKKKAQHITNVTARRRKEKHFSWKAFTFVGILAIIIIGGFLYFKLPQATIEIWPSIETLTYTQTIVADRSADIISLAQKVIPAKYIELEKTGTQEFDATGNASDEGRSEGTVTMYNTSSSALTLKVGTHLLSDSRKYFTTLSKITIPGGSKSKPGSVQVKVQATEGGDSYNIGPANFSVPKLSGTNYYYSTYAVSAQAMSGGYTGDIKKITEDDISLAQESLVKTLSNQAVEDIKSQLDQDYVVLDDAVEFATENVSADKKPGTVAESFKYTATVKASAVAFKKSDLDKINKDYIISQMGSDKTILDSSFSSEYIVKSVDIADGTVEVESNFSSGVYKTINKNSLGLALVGKTSQEITEIVKSNLGDSQVRVNVKLSPFWVKSAPNSQKAIKIEVKY